MITQKISKDFGNVVGKNAKIVKVLYQATNQLIYIITYETIQRTLVTYTVYINQDGVINSIGLYN